MTETGRTTLVAAILVVACSGPPGPVFEIELWPEEGRPIFESDGGTLSLREAPDRTAAVRHNVEIPAGIPIDFHATRYQTWVPGRIEVVEASTILGRHMGDVRYVTRDDYYMGDFPRSEWSVLPGDTIEYLQYRAEGSCFVRIRGVVVDTERCPTFLPESFRLLENPVIEWWIEVEIGDSLGWLRVDDAVRVRRFERVFVP
jgi:hypothetical protein